MRGLVTLSIASILLFTCALGQPPPPPSTSTKKWIVSGAQWFDTDGELINAHGGGITKFNDTFYWVGGDIGCCGGTNLYSSPDLVTWKNEGMVYSQGVSRPKLVWSEETQLWNVRTLWPFR